MMSKTTSKSNKSLRFLFLVIIAALSIAISWTVMGSSSFIGLMTIEDRESSISKNNTNVESLFALPENRSRHNASLLKILENHSKSMPRPRNLRLALMGDSLTRYQYLSLAHFLRHGTWIDPSKKYKNMVLESKHPSWTSFYNDTNALLSPYETCDCFRVGVSLNHDTACENRYFWDPEQNNSVSYFQKFGHIPFKSNWNFTHIHHQNHNLSNPIPPPVDQRFVIGANWTTAIRDFVSKIKPKPTVFVFNHGFWDEKDAVSNSSIRVAIVKSITENGMTSVYKTTTKKRWESSTASLQHGYEAHYCNNLTNFCYDLSWTGLVSPDMYWDKKHFTEPAYKWMNVELLNLMSKIHSMA